MAQFPDYLQDYFKEFGLDPDKPNMGLPWIESKHLPESSMYETSDEEIGFRNMSDFVGEEIGRQFYEMTGEDISDYGKSAQLRQKDWPFKYSMQEMQSEYAKNPDTPLSYFLTRDAASDISQAPYVIHPNVARVVPDPEGFGKYRFAVKESRKGFHHSKSEIKSNLITPYETSEGKLRIYRTIPTDVPDEMQTEIMSGLRKGESLSDIIEFERETGGLDMDRGNPFWALDAPFVMNWSAADRQQRILLIGEIDKSVYPESVR